MKLRATFAILSALVCGLFLTGCTGGDGGITLSSSWNKTQAKTYEYKVSFTPDKSTCGYEFNLTDGSYTTTVTPSVDESGEQYLLYETTLTITGAYVKGEESVAFTDVTTTKTLMHGINTYSMFPVSSERVMKQHSVYPLKGAEGYEVRTYDYQSKTAYDYAKKKAVTTFNAYNEQTGAYDLAAEGIPTSSTYTKLKAASFFDNDAMTFAFRAFPLKAGFSASFTTLDTVNAKKTKMYLSAGKELVEREYDIAGVKTNLDVLKLTVSIDAGTTSGKAYTLYYAPMEGQAERNLLTEMITSLPYGMGTLTYSLISM